MTEEVKTKHSFTFESGLAVEIQRVSPFLINKVSLKAEREFTAEHGTPIRPTYEVTTAGGDVEVYEHDETTVIEEPYKSDEELQELWEKYQALLWAIDAAINTAAVHTYAIKGVVGKPPKEWRDEQKYFGLDVPKDAHDAKLEWVKDNASGWDELLNLAIAIQRIPSPTEEAAEVASRSFRGPMEDAERDDVGGSQEEVDQESES